MVVRGWRDGGSGVILIKEIKVSDILDEKNSGDPMYRMAAIINGTVPCT